MVEIRSTVIGNIWLKKGGVNLGNTLRLCFVACVLLLNTTKTHAQKLVFENIGIRSGLPSTEVYNLFQDYKGYLWIFTEYGIVKYNGSNYVPVCKNLPLKESAVYAVASSANGNIFIANSVHKIYRICNDKAFKVLGTENITRELNKRPNMICDLFVDNSNGLHIGTFAKNYFYPANKYSVKRLKKEKIHKTAKRGKLFAVRSKCFTGKYTYRFDVKFINETGKKKLTWFKDTLGNSRIIARSWKNNEYVFSSNFVKLRNAKGELKKYKFQSLILNMEIDKNGHIWVAPLEGGLVEFDAQLNVVDHYFDKIIVSDILFDKQGGMWISTIGRGIFHCKDINQKSYNNIPDLKNQYVDLLREENNRLFIGTYAGSLYHQEGGKTQKIEIGHIPYAISDVLYINRTYLVASSMALVVLDDQFNVQKTILGSDYALQKMDDDNVLMASANTISKYRLKEKQRISYLHNAPVARSLSRRFGNEFFATTILGILRIKDFKYNYPAYLASLKDKSITRTITGPDNTIWFCSKGNGMYCLHSDNKLRQYLDLPATIVNDICFTKTGRVVIATNKGAFTAPKSKMAVKSAWKLILNEESWRLAEFEHQLFIGTKRGLTAMNCAELTVEKKYRFHLNSIATGGRQLRIGKDLVFNYNQNDLYLNYDLLNFHTSEKQLEYKLVGPTQLNDVVSGMRLHLQNLTPGEYVLYVNPLMNNTKISDLQVVTKFTVRPAFWQTWTFRIVVLIIILSTIFLIFWLINNRRNKKIQEVNQIENLLTEYRLTALKSQVNPHFMSNSLVAIQRLILENETDKANQYIAKFSLLLRSLLEYSNRSSATIRNELKMIELYVELEQLRFSHHFLFEIQIDPKVNPDSTYMPALITQPFVENAIWHGLLPLGETKQAKLILSVTEYDNGIVISVKDNGVGREFNKEKKKHGEFESRGTSLIVQRMENLNRLYNSKEGRIDFVDLKDENGQPAGTEVDIVLPDEILIQLYDRRNS